MVEPPSAQEGGFMDSAKKKNRLCIYSSWHDFGLNVEKTGDVIHTYYIYMYVYTYIYICIHIYIHTYTRMYIESTTTTLQSSFLLTSKEFINTPRLKTGLPPWIVHVLCVLFGCKIPNLDQQRVEPDPMSLIASRAKDADHFPFVDFDTGSTAMLNHKKVPTLSDINRISTCGVCGLRTPGLTKGPAPSWQALRTGDQLVPGGGHSGHSGHSGGSPTIPRGFKYFLVFNVDQQGYQIVSVIDVYWCNPSQLCLLVFGSS